MDQTEALVKTIVEGLQETKGKKRQKHCNRRLNPIIRLDLPIYDNLRRKYTYPGFRIV